MADNSMQKSLKSNDKPKYNNVIHKTTSESLRLSEPDKGVTHPTTLQAPHNPRKISSFQITSVTVGSRVSTDAGEDSADDLDESHTDEISRVTDFENETPSFSEDTFSKDDVFYNASSASVGCAPVIPTSSQYGLAIVGQEGVNQQGTTALNNSDPNDMHVSVSSSGAGSIINIIGNTKPQEGMKDIQEHVRNERFKVVKIESTEPFRRGRWTCMDYLDHSNPQTNVPTITNSNLDDGVTVQAPDSGIIFNDNQSDDLISSKDVIKQTSQIGATLQTDPNIQKTFSMASPGQSLTQPVNLVSQNVSVQSPPLELPQQMNAQTIQGSQQVSQQHPQSMTHINLQNQQNSHPTSTQPQNVQQIPQSFPQHQLQQVIAQSQGIPQLQTMPIHQQIPQQMQQLPNQAQLQQMTTQHLSQAQPSLTNLTQIPQQLGGLQGMAAPPQMQQVPNQQSQLQQLQMQQMQGQTAQPQMHQMQPTQLGLGQQAQLQHMSNQAQMQALQSQQLPNHLQQIQLPGQMNPNQPLPQLQPQMHQMAPNQQTNPQQVVSGIHPQIQAQYNQTVNQQTNPQAILGGGIPSSQQQMVSTSHSVNYQTQMTQGQTLPQDVLTNIATSQGNTVANNLQSMPSQPQGSTLPSNVQSMANQPQNMMHPMSQQGQSMPQGAMQRINQTAQSMSIPMENNQSMQIPVSDTIYMQSTGVNPQLPMTHNLPQAQSMMQQVNNQGQNQQHMSQQNQHLASQNQQHLSQQNQQHLAQQNQQHLAQQNQQHLAQQNQQHLAQQNQQHLAQQNQQHLAQQNQINMQYVLTQQQSLQGQTNQSQGSMQNQQPSNVQQMSQQLPQVSMPNPQSSQPIMQNMAQVQHNQNIQMPIQQNISASMQGTSVHSVPTNVVQSQTSAQASIPAQVSLSMGTYAPQGLPQNILPVMSQTNINNNVTMQSQALDVNQSVATSQSILSGTNSPVVSLPNVYPGNQSVVADGQSYTSPVSVVNNMVNSAELVCGQEGVHSDGMAMAGDINDGKDDAHQQPNPADDESFNGLAMALGGGSGAGSPSSSSVATMVAAAIAGDSTETQSSRAASPGPAGDRTAHHASASGTSAVAIDNKIEQAMDLVKSHLMFAVREEVEVLKERIAELMERITQLEVENSYLRAHASPDTLAQLPVAAPKPAPQPSAPGPVS